MERAHELGYATGVLIGMLVVVGILLLPAIFYLLTLQKAFQRCSPENRAIQPGLVWLMFIPLFNVVWHFFIVLRLATSLDAEYRKRGIPEEPQPGKNLGLAMCILVCCSFIPLLGILCSLGALVCWIIYWVKIADFSNKLAAVPVMPPVQY
jgi:hypothetical protein